MSTVVSAAVPWSFIFNTPVECGLRSVALLVAAYPQACDLQRLVQYDYLVVHSGDVEGGPPSIHPATPHRSGELLVRRSLVEQGLEFMARKSIVEKRFQAQGVLFQAGEYATPFLIALSASYTLQLRERAEWVIERFQPLSDSELYGYMSSRWSQWGAEFVRESLFDMGG